MVNSRKSEYQKLKQLQLEKLENLKQEKRKKLLAEIAKLKSQIKLKVKKNVAEEIRNDLLKAIKQNNSTQITILVELKANPNDVFNYKHNDYYNYHNMHRGRKQTMLTYAISEYCVEAVKTLLELKADPNQATPPWELWQGNAYSQTLMQRYNAETPLEHAISSEKFSSLSQAEKEMQPHQICNGQGYYLDILSQKNLIEILLCKRAAITDEACKMVASQDHRSVYGDSISSLLESHLNKIRISEMESSFELMSNNKEKEKMPTVYMLPTLINLIASYLLFSPTKEKKEKEKRMEATSPVAHFK